MADPFGDPGPSVSAPFPAQFYGSCTGCGEFISEGDPIVMSDGGAWCEDCAGDISRPDRFIGTTSEEMGF